jgi:glycosyltransferase involved in cell wall biosynthesis
VRNMPYFIDGAGRVLLERSWHHDLIQHLGYLAALSLAAPLCRLPDDISSLVPLEDRFRARLKLVPLPAQTSRLRALIQLPATVLALWRAIGEAEIVQSGVVGWPYPLGWLASPIAAFRRKKLLIIVESAPWRAAAKMGCAASGIGKLRKQLEASVYELLARYWCSRADLSFYTQPYFLTEFHGSGKGPAYVTPATWINAEDILDQTQARTLWDAKLLEPVRFLFAGRLVEEKGVRILLNAVDKLAAAGLRGEMHVIGEGPLRDEVKAAQRTGSFGLKYFEPVPYGAPFLEFLQGYHAIIVPSLSDEQPRIVFDAAARAVPVVASATNGLRPHIEDKRTGLLIPPGDVSALANLLASLADDPSSLRALAMEALARVRSKTHRAMHAERSHIIALHLGPK